MRSGDTNEPRVRRAAKLLSASFKSSPACGPDMPLLSGRGTGLPLGSSPVPCATKEYPMLSLLETPWGPAASVSDSVRVKSMWSRVT